MAILGLMVGSFLNVVIYRLPIMMQREWKLQCNDLLEISEPPADDLPDKFNLFVPRSRCPHCKELITSLLNIPVISYLVLRGKCQNCDRPISIRYPSIELFTCVITAVLAWHFNPGMQFLLAAIFSWSLICLAFIDIDHQLLPDDITLPVLWLGIIVNMTGMFTDIYSSLFGVILGYGILWSIFISYKFLTGRDGMGHGDFKLLALLGAWLGWQQLPFIILFSSLFGVIVGLSLMVISGHDRKTPFPFGPCLALAGWIALLWGDFITVYYLSLHQ